MSITERVWGWYEVLSSRNSTIKVKELVVDPGKRLSYQRHFKRSELWFVSEGTATVKINGNLKMLRKFDTININVGSWHQLINETNKMLHIVEIQYGEECIEEDIERTE